MVLKWVKNVEKESIWNLNFKILRCIIKLLCLIDSGNIEIDKLIMNRIESFKYIYGNMEI